MYTIQHREIPDHEENMPFFQNSPLRHLPEWQIARQKCSDNSFGPFVDCRFDFTLVFEQSIFSCFPSLVVILLTPFIINSLVLEKRKVISHPIFGLKMVLLPRFEKTPVIC
jgi:hypothetical protein